MVRRAQSSPWPSAHCRYYIIVAPRRPYLQAARWLIGGNVTIYCTLVSIGWAEKTKRKSPRPKKNKE
jgi:hypothetical protein